VVCRNQLHSKISQVKQDTSFNLMQRTSLSTHQRIQSHLRHTTILLLTTTTNYHYYYNNYLMSKMSSRTHQRVHHPECYHYYSHYYTLHTGVQDIQLIFYSLANFPPYKRVYSITSTPTPSGCL